MKNFGITVLKSILLGVTWAITMAVIGVIAKGCWYALSFGWNLV